ncbi:hypothetical protein GGQ22_01945 [Nocardioides sp. zg-579]|uniref:WD40 repeat domain-containing protein n=1 Tax=Nocardioides marmotae TaxID=2663857 RepID=A0A6I3J4E8_9ACTN|nr:hypothetical protein [Nocardioides marmotae]MCR6030202.1 hypothetical protein [Gordonia jinghuaiqii]MTB93834.1 hypothetical protein [Nocardioides marmotae]QKE00165.1 hypothetical protein HPC71_03015 [Nocardioides marmotae]
MVLERVLTGLAVVPFLLAAATAPAGADGLVVLRLTDPDIVESSGLAVVDGLFVTVNDSGDTGRVFVVDPATGDTVGVTRWTEDPVDVEAVAPAGGSSVWVGDIGDNRGARESITVARVPVGRTDRDADPATYTLVHPDGARDAESLLVEPGTGRLVVVTKTIFGAEVLEAPEQLDPDGPNELEPVGAALPVATDGAFFPDGRHLVLRDYSRAVVYTWPDLEQVGEVRLPEQQQGEGIAVDDEGRVFVSSEGVDAPVLRVPLPADLRAQVAGVDDDPASTEDAAPTSTPTPGRGLGVDLTEVEDAQRPEWPWFLGGFLALGVLVALLRSMRPR